MAYDRYDTRDGPRDERSRWSDERHHERDWAREGRPERGRRDERGFFERAGEEIASWFGGDDDDRHAERQRGRSSREHERDRDHGWSGRDRSHERSQHGDFDRERGRGGDDDRSRWSRDRNERDWNENRGAFARGGSSGRDYNPDVDRDREFGRGRGYERDRDFDRERGYRPMTGDYGRSRGHADSEQMFAVSGVPRRGVGNDEPGRSEYGRSETPWGRDDYRRSSFAGSRKSERDFDPHYHSWRDRHLSELDRDYDDYRREHQSRFEDDFSGWRERRTQKRGLLSQIRPHMEVVGSDDQHVGTVDKVAGDRLILTKSDPESGGAHHSLSCAEIDRIEGDRVILDCSAGQARQRWRDESRSRALFEREDQGEMGPGILDRSFQGTYR